MIKTLLLVFTLVILAQSAWKPSTEYTSCLQNDCKTETLAVAGSTSEQLNQNHKFQKCWSGSKSDQDTADVAASVTHHADCSGDKLTDAAAMKTCFTSCKTQEITDSTNPYKAYYECQNTCLDKQIAAEKANGSMVLRSSLMMVLAFALFVFY